MFRRATAADSSLLVTMVALAADWRPESDVRSATEVLTEPSLAHYATGWPGAGEAGFVAEMADGTPIGAAWWRFLSDDDGGTSSAEGAVPEVALAVVPEHRSEGVGTALLQQLVDLAREEGLAALGLSVERDNPAMSTFAAAGFVEVGGTPEEATMLLRIDDVDAEPESS